MNHQMDMMQTLRRIVFGLVLTVITVSPALAGVEQIVADFKPLAGYVVMEMDGEYIIDLDAAKGVRVGDIFAAVTAGQKIKHPVTGEILGTLDTVRAQLRVSKVKSGYSYAVPLPGSSKLKPGEAIQRFQGIPATFWDYTGDGQPLYTELKAGLPAVEWTGFAAAQAQKPERPKKIDDLEGLVFILDGKGLEVRDATFQPIRFYSRADLAREGIAIAAAAPAMTAPEPDAPATPSGIVAAPLPAAGSSGGIVEEAGRNEGVWYGPDMAGEMVGVAPVDLDGDGQLDLAIAFSNKILLGNLSGGHYTGLGFIDLPERIRVAGIESADLDRNGKPELYVTAFEPSAVDSTTEDLVSMVLEPVDGSMQIIEDDLPYFLGSVDLPGEGTVIVAQEAEDLERTYSGRVYRLERDGNKFRRGEAIEYDSLKLTAQGFVPFDYKGQTLIALLDINEKLEVIDPGGNRLWAGGEVVGGSQTYIARPDPNARATDQPVHHFLKARLAKLPDGTILVPFNEGSTRVFYKREFSKSRLIGMQWDGHGLKEIWHTEPQPGYLADFRVADVDNDGRDEIVMGVLFSQGGLLSAVQKRSALVVYELP